MEFASADPSAIRSIKQRVLLQSWMRALRGDNLLPRIGDFQPDGIANELADMMAFDVEGDGEAARFVITQEGSRVTATYAGEHVGPTADRTKRYLDDVIDAERYGRILSCYQACLARKRPVYSVSRVLDADNKAISYERLLLPFGRGDRVEQIIGSYKAVSIVGGVRVTNLAGLKASSLAIRVVSAVIDSPPTSRATGDRPDEVIVPSRKARPHFPGFTSLA
jgi:hypothetical protein